MSAQEDQKDLAMYRKVKALSELEICIYLAQIEGLQIYVQFNSVRVNVAEGDDYYFNPLANSEQLMELMVKHDVERTWEQYDFIGWSYHVLGGVNPIHVTERQDFSGNEEQDLSMHKAVCLAIILNKSEAFKLSADTVTTEIRCPE